MPYIKFELKVGAINHWKSDLSEGFYRITDVDKRNGDFHDEPIGLHKFYSHKNGHLIKLQYYIK